MQKYLNDELGVPQQIPYNLATEIFKLSPKQYEEAKNNNEQIIVVQTFTDDNYDVQVCSNTKMAFANNAYLVLVYPKKDYKPFAFGHPCNQYPAIWDRPTLDYFDYLTIQLTLNHHLEKNNLPLIKVDFDSKGRFLYTTTETSQEIDELMRKGEQYHIVQLFCEQVPEMVENAKKFALEYSNALNKENN